MKKVNRIEKKNNKTRRKMWKAIGIASLVILPVALVSAGLAVYFTCGNDVKNNEMPKVVNANAPTQDDDPETILIFK